MIVMYMLRGAPGATPDHLRTILDRGAAVKAAIEAAMPDGIVVLMGKGTEKFQLVHGQKLAYSDHGAAMDALRQLAGRARATPQP